MKLRPLPNTVVNLRTKAEMKECMQMYEKAGWMSCSGRTPPQCCDWWPEARENTCVIVKDEFNRSRKGYFLNNGYAVLTLSELKAKLGGKDPKKQEKKKPASYAITSPDQLKHGMRVTCEIRRWISDEWNKVEDAKISVDKNGAAYICQNVISGASANDELGYKFSWLVRYDTGDWLGAHRETIRNLRAVDSIPKPPKTDTWTLDAPIYRRGSDWIREDKMSIAGIEYTFDEVCEQEALFRAFRRAHSRYFPKKK